MRTIEAMIEEIETTDGGEGPAPLASYTGTALNEIMDAVEDRDDTERRISRAVARAREEGATWAMIGQALGVTRQGALKRYRQAVTA